MKAIILSAGVGSRLSSLTKTTPKCLLRLKGCTILERQVKILSRCGIKDISVVVGLEGDCWSGDNHRKVKSICSHVIFNDSNVSKGRIYSLFKGIESVDKGPVLLIDGDLFFEKVVIDKVLEADEENIILCKEVPSNFEGRKILVGGNESIIHFGVNGPVKDKAYINAGLMKIGRRLFKDLKKVIIRSANHNKNISSIMDGLCKSHKINVITSNGRWVNLNTKEDIECVRRMVTKKDIVVVWDLDGVIFDSEPLQLLAYKKAFASQRLKITDNDYLGNMGRKDAFQRICLKYNADCDFKKWYKEKNRIYWKGMNKGISMLPGVKKLMKEIDGRGYIMSLVSSTSRKNILLILNKLDIRDYFEEIIGFEDTKKGKPDPEPYLKIAEKLNIHPRKCIVIEDTGVGVDSAKKAGMKCIAVTKTNRLTQSHKKADLVIESLVKLDVEKLKKIIGE